MRIPAALLCLAVLLPASSAIHGQNSTPSTPRFTPVAPIAFDTSGPVLRAHTEELKPFTVAGERGVILGQQDGTFEAWVLPVKLLSQLTIEAAIEGYTVPIDVNQQSAEVEVRPDRTVITYAHIGFTLRQIMFSPEEGPSGTGPVVLFEFDCLHPTDFTFRFTPALEYMWPERNEGHPGPEWVTSGSPLGSGYYVLHADYPDLAGAITIPGAQPGIMAPYQERPQVHPIELKLHIDPARDRGKLYPLLMAAGTNKDAADTRALGTTLEKLNQGISATYSAHAASYKKLLADSVSIDTPDKTLNEAFQWAVVSIEQLKARPVGTDETALVAGYYASGDSARPGFGWFFGRDALYTLYAVNGFGDFGLARSELEFLIKRQRADGKIMHEYSQTASRIDWQQFPYMYAAADSTPLFLLAMLDYVRASGDTDFLKSHHDAVERAWAFETGHADSNGIYDNRQGTGWVESWPGGMPHQEIYLALLDQQASAAMSRIYELLNEKTKALEASAREQNIAATIDKQFDNGDKGCYAFSRNADGSFDRTTTVYPALAWWSDESNTRSILPRGDQCLQQLASHTLNTDWGLRDVSNDEKIYDGMSYHQGSVWPLFTGWAALAEYRGNQPLAGYQMLMENANLTRAQDLGSVTELLSGDFNVPFGRSTSHQLWSSAMVITPTLRGLFGISIDAQTKTITVNPHLPAGWSKAEVHNLGLGSEMTSLYFEKKDSQLEIYMSPTKSDQWHLKSDAYGASIGPPNRERASQLRISPQQGLRLPLPGIQVDNVDEVMNLIDSVAAVTPNLATHPGARTQKFRILHSEYDGRQLKLIIEGLGGSDGVLRLIRNGQFVPKVVSESPAGNASVSFRSCDANPTACTWYPLTFHFPEGGDWKTINITLSW
jgi:glycogen debranching enzyme